MENTIKVERAILNLTQDDLAKKIGVSRQTINSIEANRYVPSTVLALKLFLLQLLVSGQPVVLARW